MLALVLLVCSVVMSLTSVYKIASCTAVIYKVKLPYYTPWRRLGERRYSPYSFLTSALDRGVWSASRPGRALPPRKGPPVPIRQEVGWAPEPVWTQRLEKNPLPLSGIEPGHPVRSQPLY
jgi:hypothetical protein